LIQIRKRGRAAEQTGPIDDIQSIQGRTREHTVKDLTTYVLAMAAVLAATLAVAGLLLSQSDAAPTTAAQPQAAQVVHAAGGAAATMNIPF
jgi:hypothetical protein